MSTEQDLPRLPDNWRGAHCEKIYAWGLQCFEVGRQQGMLPKPSKLDRECLRLGQEIQRAAADLPEGWAINIELMKDAGSVDLVNPAGECTGFYDMADGMSHALTEAITAANEPPKA